MKILFIGGNGNISWSCSQRAIERGHEVWQLNREVSVTTRRKVQPQVQKLKGDMRETKKIQALLEQCSFDVVCDFICYNGEHARADIDIFQNKTKRFIFISSESVYKRNPIMKADSYTEKSEKYDINCSCEYITGKLEAEQEFMEAYEQTGFPIILIRPSYTYDTIFPVSIGHNCFTAPELILKGYPLLVAGDGENLWTFTHASDFAEAFIGLIENEEAVGHSFNICTEERLSWNDQSAIVLKALGAEHSEIFHVPFHDALTFETIQPKVMMYHRMKNNICNVDKLKQYVPGWTPRVSFEEGIHRTIQWLNEDIRRKRHVDRIENALMNIYERYGIKRCVQTSAEFAAAPNSRK